MRTRESVLAEYEKCVCGQYVREPPKNNSLILGTDHWISGHVTEGSTYFQMSVRVDGKDVSSGKRFCANCSAVMIDRFKEAGLA